VNSTDLSQRIDRVLAEFQIPPAQRTSLRLALIREVAQAQIEGWMQVASTPDLATLSIRDLKDRAKAAKLPGYSTMTKAELVAALASASVGSPSDSATR
jgi:hypothetical protein